MIHVHISYILYIFLKDITYITSKSHPLWRACQKFPLLLKHPDDSTCIKADGHPLSWSSIGRHLSRKGFFGGSCGKLKQIFKNLVENDICKLSLNMIFENDISFTAFHCAKDSARAHPFCQGCQKAWHQSHLLKVIFTDHWLGGLCAARFPSEPKRASEIKKKSTYRFIMAVGMVVDNLRKILHHSSIHSSFN